MTRSSLLAAVAVILAASVAQAQQQRPPRCAAPEYRQFDFWLGSWVVYDTAGTVVGTNHITMEYNGCALRESWESNGGPHRGGSFNIYDRTTQRWHQTWVDNSGLLLRIDGGLVNGAMVLSGVTKTPQGEQHERITWTRLSQHVVRQLWEQSRDGGKTWSVAFDGRYHRLGTR